MHKSQVFLYFILAFISGAASASLVNWPYVVSGVLFGLGLFLVILFWPRSNQERDKRGNWLGVMVSISLVLFVCGAIRYSTVKLNHGILSEFARKQLVSSTGKTVGLKVELIGYIKDEPSLSSDKQTFALAARQLVVSNETIELAENVQVAVKPYPRYHYGQVVSVLGTLNLPKTNNGDSYKNYLAKDGIFTTMLYPAIQDGRLSLSWWQQRQINLFSKIFAVRNTFEQSLSRSLSEPSASFVGGILLGTRAQIPQPIKDAFARTSLTHVLAISGYNVTIIAEIIVASLLYFMRRPTAFWFAVAMIFLFTILTGAQASVVRAAIMGCLVLLARHQGRFYNVKNAVALAAGVMVFANPLVLSYDVGFQLSFAATLGLILLSPQIETLFTKLPKSTLRDTTIMTISAQVFVLPLLIYYFGNISVIALPANLLILPSIPVTMLLGFLAGLAGLILPILGQIVGYFAWCLAMLQLAIVQWLAAPSWASLNIIFTWPMVVVSYLLLFTTIFRKKLNSAGRSQTKTSK